MSSKRAIQNTAEAAGDLNRNKIATKIAKVSRGSPRNNSETITNERDKEIPKERYKFSEERQYIVNDLR